MPWNWREAKRQKMKQLVARRRATAVKTVAAKRKQAAQTRQRYSGG